LYALGSSAISLLVIVDAMSSRKIQRKVRKGEEGKERVIATEGG
jgi:hypothetical protein